MDEYEQFGPAIGALRDDLGKSQPQIQRSGGPSVSEQSRVEQGGTLSPSMVEKYATAFGNLGATRIASALLPISRVLLDEDPPEQPIDLTPSAIVINVAMGRFSTQRIEATKLVLGDRLTTAGHSRTWETVVEQLVDRADQVFAEQIGAPAPITRGHLSPPLARFRSGYNRDQDVIAIDPLEDLPGKSLARVQQMLATLTEGRPTRSTWAALMLYAIVRRTPIGAQRSWTKGPLAALFAAESIASELFDSPAEGFEGVAGLAALLEAQEELRDLLRPFLDSITDAVTEVDSEGRMHLAESAVTTISALKEVESVAFGPGVAPAAALLASLATGKDRTVLTVRPTSVTVARSYYTAEPPARLELGLLPGFESIAVAQWRGETVAMRLR